MSKTPEQIVKHILSGNKLVSDKKSKNMANPASVFAHNRGLDTRIINSPNGQSGQVFTGGKWVDEWNYFRQHNQPQIRPNNQPPIKTPIIGIKKVDIIRGTPSNIQPIKNGGKQNWLWNNGPYK